MVRWIRSIQQGLQRAWWACWRWFKRWLWSPFVRGIRSAWQWLQRTWWRWSERWPVSSVVVFVKALPLLALWLFAAFAVFYRLLFPLMGPGEETFTLLVALVAALVGFGLQQWKSLTEEESNRRQRRQKAIEEIESLGSLLRSDLSAAARRYMELSARGGGVWKSGQVQHALQELWKTTAPTELRCTVELLSCLEDSERFFSSVKSVGPEHSGDVLLWAVEQLDDEWRQKASNGVSLLVQQPEYRQYITGAVLQAIEQRPWRAILQAWSHVSLWRGFPPAADPELARGLRYLGLKSNPFGSGQAETDTLLRKSRIAPPWLEDLHGPRSALLVGGPGSGKTATALLLAYDNLQRHDAFPVYYPATPDALRLDDLAQVLAQTLPRYLVIVPAGFLKRAVAGRSAIAHLLARYVSPNLALCFHQAGLPSTGEDKLLREIEDLTHGCSFQKPLTDNELLALLSEARPRGFQYTIMLLDVQRQTDEGENTSSEQCLQSLLDLSDALARVCVFIKIFLPDTFQKSLRRAQLPLEPTQLQWSNDDLFRLLKNRLKQFGDETLVAWCDPREGYLSPDSRLVRAAQGTPGGLIRKGNELLRRIGQTQHRLTVDDLDDVLGYYPLRCLVNLNIHRLTTQDGDAH